MQAKAVAHNSIITPLDTHLRGHDGKGSRFALLWIPTCVGMTVWGRALRSSGYPPAWA